MDITKKIENHNRAMDLYNQTTQNFRETISSLARGLSILKSAIPDLETSGRTFLNLRRKYNELQSCYPNEMHSDVGERLSEIGNYLLENCRMLEIFISSLQNMVDHPPPTMHFGPRVEVGEA